METLLLKQCIDNEKSKEELNINKPEVRLSDSIRSHHSIAYLSQVYNTKEESGTHVT